MSNLPSVPSHLVAFEDHHIRRKWHNNEWLFSVVDVVGVLSESANARRYWSDLKRKVEQEQGENQLYEKIVQLKLPSADGKLYTTDCANTETMLRIIQSVPSPKAEPFKLWLAKIGYERIKEIENPELATQRTRELYKAKGYPNDWIEKRMRGIAVREKLTEEWGKRGVKGTKEYAILTAEISQATFGLKPQQYKNLKSLGKQHNLRDHMNDLELIFTMLGEAATTEIAQTKNAHGFNKNRVAAIEGGKVAGKARKELEVQTGRKVVSKTNYLPETKKIKKRSEG
ncbi:MAG: Bro-N domain-containing protein [Alphaproteobacteria bacterium]|nr:Bro-N domain-containing protein [Alphaproteobacteria bacterium]